MIFGEIYFDKLNSMIEKINVDGKPVLVLIEPHAATDAEDGHAQEYFTASYALEAMPGPPGGVMILENDKRPKRFASPVEALEYASEKLQGIL